jgi:hypothetical protein
MGPAARAAVPSLLKALRDDEGIYAEPWSVSDGHPVRAAVARALGEIGGPDAVRGLSEIVRADALVVEAGGDRGRFDVVRAALRVLGAIGPEARAAVPDLVRLIDADNRHLPPDGGILDGAIRALDHIVEPRAEGADALVPVLTHFLVTHRPSPHQTGDQATRYETALRIVRRRSAEEIPGPADERWPGVIVDARLDPEDRALVRRAGDHLAAGRWAEAEGVATRGIARGIRSDGVYRVRAHARAEQGRWAEAADDFAALARWPDRGWPPRSRMELGYLSEAHRMAGRSPVAYRYLCSDLAAFADDGIGYGSVGAPEALARYYPDEYPARIPDPGGLLRFLVWLPPEETEFADVMIVAQRGKQAFPGRVTGGRALVEFLRGEPAGFSWITGPALRGAAYYRLGLFDRAAAALEESERRESPRAWDQLFRAMTYHHLGRGVEARRRIDLATRWIRDAEAPAACDDQPRWRGWSERLEVTALEREARGLIGGLAPPDIGDDRGVEHRPALVDVQSRPAEQPALSADHPAGPLLDLHRGGDRVRLVLQIRACPLGDAGHPL